MSARFVKLDDGKKYVNLENVVHVRFEHGVATLATLHDVFEVKDPGEIIALRAGLEKVHK